MGLQTLNESTQWEHFFQTSHQRFVSYYLQYLQEHANHHDFLEAEKENIRDSWLAAVKQKQDLDLLSTVEPLYQFFRTKGHINEGQTLFATAVSHLAPPNKDIATLPTTRQTLYGRLLAHQAWFCHSLAQYSLAERLIAQAQPYLGKEQKQDLILLITVRGNIALFGYGNIPKAQELFRQSYQKYEEIKHLRGQVQALSNLGSSYIWANEFDTAISLIEKSIAICKAHGFGFDESYARCLNNLGVAFEGLEEYPKANAAYHECFEVCQQLHNKHGMAYSLANQSQIALRLGFFAKAKNLCVQQLNLSKEIGEQVLIIGGLADLGNAHYMLGNLSLAEDCLIEGLAIAFSTKAKPSIVQIYAQFARLMYHLGQDIASFSLLTLIQDSPLPHQHLGNPENLHEILVAKLPKNEVKIIQEKWKGKDLDEAVTLIQNMKK